MENPPGDGYGPGRGNVSHLRYGRKADGWNHDDAEGLSNAAHVDLLRRDCGPRRRTRAREEARSNSDERADGSARRRTNRPADGSSGGCVRSAPGRVGGPGTGKWLTVNG